ncbi:kinase-like domain-containing protein [Infundibulicybe gibba]|nr:kinase-like domain-containing protein [Infundibulicybe gibba]
MSVWMMSKDYQLHSNPKENVPPTPTRTTTIENASASPAAMFLSAFSSPPPAPACLPDDEGQVVSGYTLGDIIGYGGFSIIRRGFSMSGGANSALMKKKLEHEAAVWASLCHEHILPLFSALHTSYADFFITLYCPAGSLFDILKRDGSPALPQDDAGMMFRQVVRGLRYMHEVAMYVHRDIKLENILVDEMGVCRIGDFGMAKKIGEIDEEDELLEETDQYQYPDAGTVHRATSLTVPSSKRHARPSLQAHFPESRHHPVRHRNSTSSAQPSPSAHIFQPGSLPYAAPELLLPQTSGPLLPHPAQDIWALGTLLYALLTGRLPFTDSFEPRLQMKILNGVYEVPKDIGRGAERVLKGCLQRSLPGRWSIAMVDDVAWGIGWGAEGDDVTPADSDEEYEVHQTTCPTPSASRSRSRPAETSVLRNDESQQHDLGSSRIEAASRRSSSRAQRSLSRVPLLIGTRRSSGRSVSRPQSRPQSRPPSPTFSALNSSILTGDLLSDISSPTFNNSALLTSPSPSVERGRRLNKLHIQSTSLSRSPSIVPSTPIDISGGHLAILDDGIDDDLPRDSPRGRKQFSQLHHVYTTSGEPISELDILDEATGWAAPQHKNTTYNSSHSARFQGARGLTMTT